jgi:alpha-amylase
MLSPDSPDAAYRIRGVPAEESRFGSRGATADVPAVELRDGPRRFTMRMRFSEPALLWRMPVETINLSEDGFERVYQMSCLLPVWRWNLAPGERKEASLEIDFRSLGDA